MTPTFKPGQEYKHWEIVHFAGAGLHGEVYQVRNKFTGGVHGLKMMHLESSANSGNLHRALTTGAASWRLAHANVVDIQDLAAESDGRVWILMEWLDGCSIAELMARQCMRLSVPMALHVLIETCWGLHAAHERGLIHRDIKPDNVWRTESGVIKILDFSLAKVVADEAQTTIRINGTGLGTHAYLAPEALKPGAPVDGRIDVYSTGVMTWQAIAGRHPFQAVLRNTAELMRHQLYVEPELLSEVAGLPTYVDEFFRGALAKNPDGRFQSAAEMARAAMALRDRLRADVEAGEIDFKVSHGEPPLPGQDPWTRREYEGPRSLPQHRAAAAVPSQRVYVQGRGAIAKTAPMAAVSTPALATLAGEPPRPPVQPLQPASPAALAGTLPLEAPAGSRQATQPMLPGRGAGTVSAGGSGTQVSVVSGTARDGGSPLMPLSSAGTPATGAGAGGAASSALAAGAGASAASGEATDARSRTSASRTRETAPAVERAAVRGPRRPRVRTAIVAVTVLSASVATLVTWVGRHSDPVVSPMPAASSAVAAASSAASTDAPAASPPASTSAPAGSPVAPARTVTPEPEPAQTPSASASAQEPRLPRPSALPRRAAEPPRVEPPRAEPLPPPPAPPPVRTAGRLFGTEN